MTDTFNDDIKEANNMIKTIKNDMKNRVDLISKNKGTIYVESSIRGSMQKLERLIDNAKVQLKTLQQSNSKDFDVRELNRRMKMIQEIHNSHIGLKEAFDKSIMKEVKKTNVSNIEVDDCNNDAYYETLDEKQAMTIFKEKLDSQDEGLDILYGQIKMGKQNTRALQDEVIVQNEHLNEVDTLMDKVQGGVNKANNQLDVFNTKSPNTILMIIIMIELLVLVVIVATL